MKSENIIDSKQQSQLAQFNHNPEYQQSEYSDSNQTRHSNQQQTKQSHFTPEQWTELVQIISNSVERALEKAPPKALEKTLQKVFNKKLNLEDFAKQDQLVDQCNIFEDEEEQSTERGPTKFQVPLFSLEKMKILPWGYQKQKLCVRNYNDQKLAGLEVQIQNLLKDPIIWKKLVKKLFQYCHILKCSEQELHKAIFFLLQLFNGGNMKNQFKRINQAEYYLLHLLIVVIQNQRKILISQKSRRWLAQALRIKQECRNTNLDQSFSNLTDRYLVFQNKYKNDGLIFSYILEDLMNLCKIRRDITRYVVALFQTCEIYLLLSDGNITLIQVQAALLYCLQRQRNRPWASNMIHQINHTIKRNSEQEKWIKVFKSKLEISQNFIYRMFRCNKDDKFDQ